MKNDIPENEILTTVSGRKWAPSQYFPDPKVQITISPIPENLSNTELAQGLYFKDKDGSIVCIDFELLLDIVDGKIKKALEK